MIAMTTTSAQARPVTAPNTIPKALPKLTLNALPRKLFTS
nr:MAG TPA: hypothetical protein [Caudoviricetes sp.]